MELKPDDMLGRYQLVSPIGEGGMGEVWKARDTQLDRDVALKVSKSEFTARFDREARAIAAFNHPNICTLYDVGPNYLVMELIEGSPLKGPLPVERAVAYAAQILDALDAAHRRGFTHRDLKPANILVTKQGIKLLDFGLAKRQSTGLGPDDTTGAGITATGQITGTLQYMSPEQLQGQEADARSDIFSFGCVLYEMLSGKKAFSGSTGASVIAAILEREPEPLQTTPPLDRVIRACLEKDPDQRFQSVRDLKKALLWATESEPELKTRTKGLLYIGWIAAAVLALVAAVAISPFGARREVPAQPVKFQIPLPDNPGNSGGEISVSPDGRKVAFLSSSAGGSSLWVRSLDSTEARQLSGADVVVTSQGKPFWSPDSSFIAFLSAGYKLRKIPVEGGPTQTICDATTFAGGTWSQDGKIIFSQLNGGLMMVPQGGGKPVPLTTVDRSGGELDHVEPQFLPDGRHFLYVARSAQDDTSAIFLGSLDSKEKKRVAAGVSTRGGLGGSGLGWAPPGNGVKQGHVLFLRENVLMAQPLDASSLDPSGEAFPLAQQADSVSLSVNGVLVYGNANVAGRRQHQMRWLDRSGKTLADVGPPAGMRDLALSPNAKRVAYAIYGFPAVSGLSIWIMDIARGVASRLSFEPGEQRFIVWSPDGSEVAYATGIGRAHDRILAKRTDGSGNPRQLLTQAVDAIPRDWSADGKWLLYREVGRQTRSDLWVLPVGSGKEEKPIPLLQSKFDEGDGRISPDGRWLAYVSDEQGRAEIFVQPFSPSSRSETAAKIQISSGGGVQPRWRSDGRELFYGAADGTLMAAEVKLTPRFEAGVPKPLFKTEISGVGSDYAVAPDGNRFLVAQPVAPTGSASGMPFTVTLNWQGLLKK